LRIFQLNILKKRTMRNAQEQRERLGHEAIPGALVGTADRRRDNMNTCGKHALTILTLALTALPALALDVPWVTGECESLGNDGKGMWTYRLTVQWDTGKHGVSHVDIIIDETGNCSASEIASNLLFNRPAGYGAGEPEPCIVEYNAVVENFDPSTNLPAVVLKYEPRTANACEPGPQGAATYEFQSPYPPELIDVEHLALVQKFATQTSYGSLQGVFPGLPCNPVSTEQSAWGSLKASYR